MRARALAVAVLTAIVLSGLSPAATAQECRDDMCDPGDCLPSRDGCDCPSTHIADGLTCRRVSTRPNVDITSTPPGAEVFLDGSDRPLGITSLWGEPIRVGPRVFVFRRRGYADARVETRIRRLRGQAVHATLQALSTLHLAADDSSAIGATARIELPDGTTQTHPLTSAAITVSGPPGVYAVEVTRDGYRSVTFSESLLTGGSETIRVRLARLEGALDISCDRPEATVVIDGTHRGTIRSTPLPVGTHSVEVRLPNGDSEQQSVTIVADTSATMSVTFNGTIAISCTTEDVYGTPGTCPGRLDFVDEAPRSQENQGFLRGTHRVRVEVAGYDPWHGTVTVRSGEAARVHARPRQIRRVAQRIEIRTNATDATIQLDEGAPQPAPLGREAAQHRWTQQPSPQSQVHFIRVAARGYESQAFACSTDGGAAPFVACVRNVNLVPITSSRCEFTSGPLSGQYRDLTIDPVRVGEPCAIGTSVGEIVPLSVDPPQSSSYCRYDIGPRRGEILPFGRSAPLGGRCGAGDAWGVIVRPPPPGFSYPRGAD